MNINEACKLITHYVYDKKGRAININAVFIMTNKRQQEMLKEAVRIAVEHYKTK